MREAAERIVEMGPETAPDLVAAEILRVTEEMAAQGWFYESCTTDSLAEQVILFFERDLDVNAF